MIYIHYIGLKQFYQSFFNMCGARLGLRLPQCNIIPTQEHSFLNDSKISCREMIDSIGATQPVVTYYNMIHNSDQLNDITFTHITSNHSILHMKTQHNHQVTYAKNSFNRSTCLIKFHEVNNRQKTIKCNFKPKSIFT